MNCPQSIWLLQPNLILIWLIYLPIIIRPSGEVELLDGGESRTALKNTRRNDVAANRVSFEDIVIRNHSFDISSRDLIVLLHIQKTGGTAFEKHLVSDLSLVKPCSCNIERRRCNCPRPESERRANNRTFADTTWLLSRYSTGWLCGLHPDWSSLSGCLSSLDGLYFATFLRNPIERFVSEFRHVQRGATWKLSKSRCKEFDTQLCYGGNDWSRVTIEEFVGCRTNMAINRQTRMLADLDVTNCPRSPMTPYSGAYEKSMLSSAMHNLKQIAFFGLCEEQRASQIVFEKTFGLNFVNNFEQSEDNKTRIMIESLPPKIRQKIFTVNHLDMELYRFAIKLFRARFRQLETRPNWKTNQGEVTGLSENVLN